MTDRENDLPPYFYPDGPHRYLTRTAPKWDQRARRAGFSSLRAALIWAVEHTTGATDPIVLLAERLGVPYRVLFCVDTVQRFLASGATIAREQRSTGDE